MKKFTADDVDTHSDHEPDATYYDTREVDARDAETFMTIRKDRQRIDELERALKSCAAVIKRQLKHVDETTAVAVQALDEADEALSL